MTHRLLFFLFSITFTTVCGQANPKKERQVVLGHNKIGKVYVFDRSKQNDHNRTELTYLGKLKTTEGRAFKILISSWYWGISPRAKSYIIIFNDKNQFLGNYYVTMTYDLPDKIENNALVFTNRGNDDCDPSLKTIVSFKNGIPKQFFLKCKGNFGDIYSFRNQ